MAYQNKYCFEGSAALSVDHAMKPRFTVVEGGLSSKQQAPAGKGSLKEELVVAAFCVVCFIAVLGTSLCADALRSSGAQSALNSSETTVVRVHSGDTLWTIAEEHPVRGVPTRQVVDWIEEQNGLESATLAPGQSLVVAMLG